MGITGRFFEKGIDDIDEAVAPHRFAADDARKYAEEGAGQFLSVYGNLLSSYSLKGEFGLWATLQTYLQTMGLGEDANQAIKEGDVAAYIAAIFYTQVNAFAALFNRGALERLMIVDSLPELAAEELSSLLRTAASMAKTSTAAVVPQPANLTATEICANDWKELGASGFKTKYMNNHNGRKIYEQTLAEGKIA
jgi:hypothetical protein